MIEQVRPPVSAEKLDHEIARLLDADPRIAFVAYPGLSNHPDHEVATRQFVGRGYGGMLAFALDGDADLQNTFVSQLGVITSAFSLGHDESLIVHVGTETRGGAENYPEAFRRFGHLRLSVGLEDVDDLVADHEVRVARAGDAEAARGPARCLELLREVDRIEKLEGRAE